MVKLNMDIDKYICYFSIYYNSLLSMLLRINFFISYLSNKSSKMWLSKQIQKKINNVFINKTNTKYVNINEVFNIINNYDCISIIKFSLRNTKKSFLNNELIRVIIQYPDKFYIYLNETDFVNFLNTKFESPVYNELIYICSMYLLYIYKNNIIIHFKYDIIYNINLYNNFIISYKHLKVQNYNYKDLLNKQHNELLLEEENYIYEKINI